MNRLQRDCFFFAFSATLLAACSTPAVIPTVNRGPLKTIKADGGGGLLEHNENLQLVKKTTDAFTVIDAPQSKQILGAIYPSPTPTPKRVSPNPRQKLYHIKYNNTILVALSAGASNTVTNAVPTNNQKAGYLRYRIWVPTDDSDNIGWWSPWAKSNDHGLDKEQSDSSHPSLSGTLLEPGKWHLLDPAKDSQHPKFKTITIQATVNNTQYTWTGTWTLGTPPDPTGRGSITWTVKSP